MLRSDFGNFTLPKSFVLEVELEGESQMPREHETNRGELRHGAA